MLSDEAIGIPDLGQPCRCSKVEKREKRRDFSVLLDINRPVESCPHDVVPQDAEEIAVQSHELESMEHSFRPGP